MDEGEKMRRRTVILLFTLVFLSLFIDYSALTIKRNSFKEPKITDNKSSTNASDKDNKIVVLTLWTYYEGFEWIVEEFNKVNHNVRIRVEVFPSENYAQRCLEAIIRNEGPDLIVLDSPHIEVFNGNEAMQDLLEEPFSADIYKNDFTESLWRLASSFDQKRLIGIPIASTPMLTYYRADIMEQYGFPTDPEKLAEYMKDPNNWLNIAHALKKDNKYIAQWASEPIRIYETGTGFFNDKLQFLRNSDEFYKGINASREVKKSGLALNIDVWSNEGNQAVRDGKLAMLYFGTWGAEQIKSWVPEQAGKWRATALPFGVKGWFNSTIISINSTSKYKEEAWDFIRFSTLNADNYYGQGYIPVYLPVRNKSDDNGYKEPFLGGQETLKDYKKIGDSVREPIITPLDGKANEIWYANIDKSITNDVDPKEFIGGIEEEIMEKIEEDKEALLDNLGE